MKAIQVMFDERLLEELDAEPEVKEQGRSAVLRQAVKDYLRRKRARQVDAPYLRTVLVAPVASTIHGVPSEVLVGVQEGLKRDSAVNLDHVQTVVQADLHAYVGSLDPRKMREVCMALALATGCS